jgi:hypothetical protein
VSIEKPLVLILDESAEAQRPDLQVTYSNYKNTLQQIAQKIGDIEQEAEEHKYVPDPISSRAPFAVFCARGIRARCL